MGRLMFGKQENLKEIQDIALRGPEGEDLYLGYKTTSFFFGDGVYMKDDGYVLGIRGQEQYYSLIARACRRIHLEVIETSALSFSQFFSLCFGSISISYPSSLLGQCHDISHQFVQIE